MQDAPEASSSRSCRRSTRGTATKCNAQPSDAGLNGNGAHPDMEESSSSSNSSSQHCNFCGHAKSSALVDLRANLTMQRRLSKDWKLPGDAVEAALSAICVECVIKLNMHSEVTRTLMQRLQRLTKASTSTPRPLTPPLATADATQILPASPRSAQSSSSNVLQPYSAQPPESPTATESGGTRNNSSNAVDGWKWRTRLVCQHCSRAYFRRDYYTQHMRRCLRRRAQLRRSRCRVLNEAVFNNDDEVGRRQRVPRKPRRCPNCAAVYWNVPDLRQHQLLAHMSHHTCHLCEAEFGTNYEWELHFTICSAKHEALQPQDSSAPVRSLRFRSRAPSLTLAEKEDENEEEEEDSASETDTMYTRRMNFTGDWIVNHSRSNSNSALNLPQPFDDDDVLEETLITTDKEFDLYQLDLLKSQVKRRAFACFAPSCLYQTRSLVELMKHDYKQHWKMSWFYCQKCGDVFTSKVFLDYHLHKQNRGVYICHKCHEEFALQHKLDRHLLMHSKGINYHCNYCRLEFLSEAKLLAHCELERHNPNDEPSLICIDHSLSINNTAPIDVPATPPQSPPPYGLTVRVLDIPQRAWPLNRPMHLPHHKPFRFSIGVCQLDSRNPPNCVRCH